MSDVGNDVRAKVLIAEDDAIVALDLQGMVMRLGYDVVALVDSGDSAIAAAQRFRPNIILLDMILNGPLDGIDVAREIHKTLDVPVIFCTASPDLTNLIRAKEISYAGYLLKPISPDSLSTTLDTALYKYKLEKRAEEAEAKFQGLSEKWALLHYFFEQKDAFEWVSFDETGAHIKDYVSPFKISATDLEAKINQVVSSNTLSDRISALIDISSDQGVSCLFALVGIRNLVSLQVSGMIIPLSGGRC